MLKTESSARDARRTLGRNRRKCAAGARNSSDETSSKHQGPVTRIMDRFKIQGGRKLEGEVRISGAKNAALPAMAATLLTAEPVHLKNIPHVRDIITMAKLLAHMRCKVESPDIPPSEFIIRAESVSHAEAPYELVKTMRASMLTLGPARRAIRLRARFSSRRMLDRRASDRPAHEGARKAGRG